MPRNFANHLLDDDDTYKIYVQASLQRIETVFGKIKYKFAKGPISSAIVNKVNTQNTTTGFAMMVGQQDSEIDALFMIDRSIDLITPFCI